MKRIIFFLLIFSLGFFSHYLVVRFKVKPLDPATYLMLSAEPLVEGSNGTFITYVEFDGESFKPNKINMKKSDYLAITNKSTEKFMWLVSASADFSTVRGYGEGERLTVNPLESGTYLVANKDNPNKTLEVVVE